MQAEALPSNPQNTVTNNHRVLVMDTPFAMYDALSAIDVPPEKVRVVVQSMEKDMALFATSSEFKQLDHYSGSQFNLLRSEIDGLRERMNERFEQAHTEIAEFKALTSQRFEQVRAEIAEFRATAGIQFELVNERMTQMESRLYFRLGALVVGTSTFLSSLLAGLMIYLRG